MEEALEVVVTMFEEEEVELEVEEGVVNIMEQRWWIWRRKRRFWRLKGWR